MKKGTQKPKDYSQMKFEDVEKMREQNEQLKTELMELATQMDEHVKQDKDSQKDTEYP